jgi:hypothetical protein
MAGKSAIFTGGYEPRDVYNADETRLFFNVLPDRTLACKGEFCHGRNIPKRDSLCYYVLIVMEVTNKCRLWLGNLRNQGLQER